MIVINGIVWKVTFASPNNPVFVRNDGTVSIGVTDGKIRTIFICNKIRGELLDRVVRHELVHAFCYSYGIKMDVKTEEVVADFLSKYGDEIVSCANEILPKPKNRIRT